MTPVVVLRVASRGQGALILRPDAAASWLRVEAQVGRQLDVNRSTVDRAEQQRIRNLYLQGKYPNYVAPVNSSEHVQQLDGSGACAVDTDDSIPCEAVLTANGWIRTDPTESWHRAYRPSRDRFYGATAGSGAVTTTPTVTPEEEPDMRVIQLYLDDSGKPTGRFALVGVRFFQETTDVNQANAWAQTWGNHRRVNQRGWDEALNVAGL